MNRVQIISDKNQKSLKIKSIIQKKIKQNIELTDPKNFKGHKEAPKFNQIDITEQERRRKTIIRHFKKKK